MKSDEAVGLTRVVLKTYLSSRRRRQGTRSAAGAARKRSNLAAPSRSTNMAASYFPAQKAVLDDRATDLGARTRRQIAVGKV
jgi:hypothetical protein